MKSYLNFLFAAVLCAAITLQSFAQTHNSISKETKHKIDSTFKALLKENKVVGTSIAIIDSGRIVYSQGYGFADKENEISANDETVYRIGSVSKTFTALSVMQLHQNEKLDYTQTLAGYIPEFGISDAKGKPQKIYICDIMSHTAGLPGDIFNGFFATNPPNQKWAIEKLNNHYTIGPRNYVMAYSNVGYGLLGELIERVSGQTYEDYLTEHIFKPLDMNASYVWFDSTKNHTLSKGYINKKLTDEPAIRDASAGLIHSNVLDLGNFMRMFLNKGEFEGNRILSSALLDSMSVVRTDATVLPGGFPYGYGLMLNDYMLRSDDDSDSSVVKYVGHGGDTFAYHADFGFFPEIGVGAVVLTNTDKGAKINDAVELLDIYMQNEKQHYFDFDYEASDSLIESGDELTFDEIKGMYNSMIGLIEVNRPDKIKFKQGPAKVVLKKNEGDEFYSARAWIFSIIPVKLKGQEFNFVKVNDQIYLNARVNPPGIEQLLGKKTDPKPIPESWEKAFGEYTVTGDNYEVPDNFPFNTEGLMVLLYEEKGFIVFELEGKVKEMQQKIFFESVDDKGAQTGTYGRNSGETLRILDNGNLYFSGFEFKKKGK